MYNIVTLSDVELLLVVDCLHHCSIENDNDKAFAEKLAARLMNERDSKVYCIACDDKVSYIITQCMANAERHGFKFDYIETHAYCTKCGGEVYVSKINDLNVERRKKAYYLAAFEGRL